jgi:hypothetical protein
LEIKVIESRLKLLNKFCVKLMKIPEMVNSEEIKAFLSNTNDVAKSLSTLPVQTYEDIVVKYTKSFPDYYKVSTKYKYL